MRGWFFWLTAICLGLLLSLIIVAGIFYALFNSPAFYDAPKELAYYTGGAVTKQTTIVRFQVRNFFGLDGPDYYYELALAPADRTRLIAYCQVHARDAGGGRTADAAVPSDWLDGDPSITQRFYLLDARSGDAQVILSLDSKSNRAWLVIYNE
ncbi:MAG: hypothetical protein WDO13_05605 [Verrucomicrobiota bacterium]